MRTKTMTGALVLLSAGFAALAHAGGDSISDPRNDNVGGNRYDIVRASGELAGASELKHVIEMDGRLPAETPSVYIDHPQQRGNIDYVVGVVEGSPGVYRFPSGNFAGSATAIVANERTVRWKFDIHAINCPNRYEWIAVMTGEDGFRDRAPDGQRTVTHRDNWLC